MMSANVVAGKSNNDDDEPPARCFNCGRTGHMSPDCEEEKAICRHCGRRHISSMHEIATRHSSRSKNSYDSPPPRARDESHKSGKHSDKRSDSSSKRRNERKSPSSASKSKGTRIYSRRQLVHMLEMEDAYRSDGNPLRTMMIQSCLETEEEEFVLEPSILFVQPSKTEYPHPTSDFEPSTLESEAEEYGDGKFILTFYDQTDVTYSFAVSSPDSSPIAIFDTGCNGAHSVPTVDFLEPDSIVDYPKFTVTGANGPMQPRAIGNLKGSNQRAIVLENCKVILISPSEFLSGIGGGTFVGDMSKLTVLDRKNQPRLECTINNGHPFCSAEHFMNSVRKRHSSLTTHIVSDSVGKLQGENSAFRAGEFYSREVMERAYEARRLHRILDHPGDKDLCIALENGCYPKCTVTAGDVKAAHEIFGPCVACITGKLKLDPQRTSTSEPVRQIGEKVHFDLIPLPGPSLGGNMHIVVALDEFSNYCIGIPIVSKNLVFSALKQVLGKFTRD